VALRIIWVVVSLGVAAHLDSDPRIVDTAEADWTKPILLPLSLPVGGSNRRTNRDEPGPRTASDLQDRCETGTTPDHSGHG
jgi:hypothetical protein